MNLISSFECKFERLLLKKSFLVRCMCQGNHGARKNLFSGMFSSPMMFLSLSSHTFITSPGSSPTPIPRGQLSALLNPTLCIKSLSPFLMILWIIIFIGLGAWFLFAFYELLVNI